MTRRHPWYAALYHTRPPAGPNLMKRLEFMLAVLTAQGASTAEAMTCRRSSSAWDSVFSWMGSPGA
jgi:Tetracyclin repressor-like, C-terminal domain